MTKDSKHSINVIVFRGFCSMFIYVYINPWVFSIGNIRSCSSYDWVYVNVSSNLSNETDFAITFWNKMILSKAKNKLKSS